MEFKIIGQICISLYWIEGWALNIVKHNQHSSKPGPWVRSGREIASIWPSHRSLEWRGSGCWGSWYRSISQTTSDPAHSPVQLWTLWVLMRGGSEAGGSGIPDAEWNHHGCPMDCSALSPWWTFSQTLLAQSDMLWLTFQPDMSPVQQLKTIFTGNHCFLPYFELKLWVSDCFHATL